MGGLGPNDGLSFSPSLWRVVHGLWSGATGFITGWGGVTPPVGDMNVLRSNGTSYGVSFTVLGSSGAASVVTNSVLSSAGTPYAVI
jgi:hypothetical protein